MDVEEKGARLNQKAIISVFTIIFVAIISLIIAIIIVINLRNQSTTHNQDSLGAYTDQSMDIYEDFTTKILDQTADDDDISNLIAAYRVYIAKTDDAGAKALLFTDYYMLLMSLDTSLAMKDEVLDGLITADNTIRTASSALAVSDAANYYQDSDLSNQYQDIAKARMTESLTEESK